MSDEETDGDPVMLVVTDLLSPGPLKIARITKDFTLPRLIPVATMVATGIGAVLGLLSSIILRAIGLLPSSFEFIAFFLVMGGFAGYSVISLRIEGQTVWQWMKIRFSATAKSRTKINNTTPRMVAFSAQDPPPEDGLLVAANETTVVYAVPGRVGKSGRVYANIAPLYDLILGEVTILESTVPVRNTFAEERFR